MLFRSGLGRRASDYFGVADVNAAKERLLLALSGTTCPEQDIVALNAGAALLAADCADTLGDGVKLAHEALASGAAREKLEALIAFA